MKSSSDSDNNNRHYFIQQRMVDCLRNDANNYFPAECVGFTMAYHFFGSWIGCASSSSLCGRGE
jgi:hypothetical protein